MEEDGSSTNTKQGIGRSTQLGLMLTNCEMLSNLLNLSKPTFSFCKTESSQITLSGAEN